MTENKAFKRRVRARAARTGESYQAFLTALTQASSIDTPTREELARLDWNGRRKPRIPTSSNRVQKPRPGGEKG